MPIKFLANHNCIVWGNTGSGKTTLILRIIKEKLIEPWPKNIFYMYGVFQNFMLHHPEITFIEGLDFDKVDTSEPSMLIIDDLITENNKEVGNAFIRGSHHLRISLFYITQNLFPNCNTFRLMSANNHYIILFNNPRNFRQVHTLARQIFVDKKDLARIFNAYKAAGQRHRDFILLSFSPLLPSELTVIGDFLKPCPSVYL